MDMTLNNLQRLMYHETQAINQPNKSQLLCFPHIGRACCAIITIIGNGHGNPSSNPGQGWLHFAWKRYEFNYSPSGYG